MGIDQASIDRRLAAYDAENEIGVLPEHWDAWLLFQRCSTQWRTSISGVVGLDYNVALSLMGLMNIPEDQQLDTLDQLGLIERGVLSETARNKDDE